MEMTIRDRIARFIEKYPNPKQYPFHLKTNGDGYRMCFDGTFMHSPNSLGWWIAAYRYDEETDLFETATIHIDCHKRNDNRNWTYHHRYFVTRDRKIYDVNGNEPSYFVAANSAGDRYAYDKKHYIMQLTNLRQATDFAEQFTAFAKGDFRTNTHSCISAQYPYYLRYWITYKEKSSNANTKSKSDVEKCMAIPLDKFDVKSYSTAVYEDFARVENHNGIFVFRQFYKCMEKITEKYRVYFFNPKKIFYLVYNNDKDCWVKNGSFTSATFRGKIKNPEVFENTRYDFINNICHERNRTIYRYVIAMREPVFEQLYKMGCDYFVKDAINLLYKSPLTALDNKLGVREEKKKDRTYKRYDFTAKQLKYLAKLEGMSYISSLCLNLFKNSYDVVHMDIKQFETLIKYVRRIDCVQRFPYWNRENNCLSAENKIVFERLCKIAEKEKNDSIFTIYRDTQAYFNRHIITTNPACIKKADELRRLHDAAIEAEIAQRAEREAKRNAELDEQRKKVDKKRKEWNYEDDNYIIRLPNTVSEIVAEGQKLHHCVGGYASRHAAGDTTIMFLREKANPDVPFYTIEVSRYNHLVQAHCFGNGWLGLNPDAARFVYKWLRNKGIEFDKKILLCTATGYSSNGKYLDESILEE